VRGFLRRLWNKSTDHRGSPDFFGLVACVVSDESLDAPTCESNFVSGLLYEVPETKQMEVLKLLDLREKCGYIRNVTEAFCSETGNSLGLSFIYTACLDSTVDVFVRPIRGYDNTKEELVQICKRILTAVGPSGSNLDYLLRLKNALDSHGFEDPHVDYIYHLCTLMLNQNLDYLTGTTYTYCRENTPQILIHSQFTGVARAMRFVSRS
jgi:cation transport protein ChaC